MEYLIAFIIIGITLVYFLLFRKKEEKTKQEKTKTNPPRKQVETQAPEKSVEVKKEEIKINSDKIVDNKSFLISSFREGKDMRNPVLSKDEKAVLFHDDKKICLGFLDNYEDKTHKFISKNVEQDVISDAAYSEEKRLIAVGLKNSKQLIFYEIIIDENNKQKLNKTKKVIDTTRNFEIKNVSLSRDGNYVFTSGTGQDTLIQIYDVKTGANLGNIDINEIQNVEMKMTPDDRYLAISTYMYEIAVLELKRTAKFNKAIEGDEITLKVQRDKSISGIKTMIDSFDFSNDNKYFVVTCENTKVKIFQNFGNFEDSKVIQEFTAKEVTSFSHDKVTMFITSSFNGKLVGFIAVSNDCDILIYDLDGNCLRILKNAHEDKVNLLKLVKKQDNSGECLLLSGSRDGRFHVWKI